MIPFPSLEHGTRSGLSATYDIRARLEGATTGNARAENSVDLCTLRSNIAYVPAGICSAAIGGENTGGTGTHTLYAGGKNNHTNQGSYCSISGFYNHSNTGTHCLISGHYNNSNTGNSCSISGFYNHSNDGNYCSISGNKNHTNSGYSCSISGYNNHTNSGNYCSISGNNNHTNTGGYCSISGRNASNNALDYARVHGGNTNARIIDLVAQITTADANATELLLGGEANNRIVIPDRSAWNVDVRFVAKTDTGAHAAIQNFTGLIVRDGASTTYAAGTSDGAITEIGTAATVTFAVSADDTNEALKLEVTRDGATNVRCSARIQLTQVDY